MDYSRIELEYAIIGELIRKGDRLGEFLPELSREDFKDPVCEGMFRGILQMFSRSAPVDRLTLIAELGSDYEEAVNEAHRRACADLPYYIEVLHRMAAAEARKMLGTVIAGSDDPEELRHALDGLNALNVTQRKRTAVTMAEAMQSFFDRHSGEAPDYLSWGIPVLDSTLHVERGDFVALGGYPSSGKTLLATQFAVSFARAGHRVGFFSLETTPEKLTDRIMTQVSQISLTAIKKNQLSQKDWNRLGDIAQELSSLCIEQIPASGMSATDIRAYALSRRYDIVIIDYLQLIRGDSRRSRYEEVTGISLELHTMAQTTGITVIALAQLSRPEKTGQKTKPTPPSMASFRESGQIEQDVDVALLLYPENPNDNDGRRVLKIGKNKEGRRAVVTLDFDGDTQTMRVAQATKSEQYQKLNHELAEIRRADHARRRAERMEGQAVFTEMPADEALPF